MLKGRFVISWMMSTVAMTILSYLWHGILLNDLMYIPSPKWLFFLLGGIVYVCIGFGLTFVYTFLSMGISLRMKGTLIGVVSGFFIYLVAFVFGISFKGSGTEHLVVDFLWQMLEQGTGGAIVGTIYHLARRRDEVLNLSDQ